MSSANGHCSCTMMLLHATSMHSPLNKQKDTPLHLAVRFGHFSCTRILLASNCDLNCQNEVILWYCIATVCLKTLKSVLILV